MLFNTWAIRSVMFLFIYSRSYNHITADYNNENLDMLKYNNNNFEASEQRQLLPKLNNNNSVDLGFDFSGMRKGLCKGLWRPQNLRGKCFGLKEHHLYNKAFANIKVVPSSKHCRYLCCYLGEECVNWQFQENSNLCKLGKTPIRFGPEATGTPLWCDDLPTSSEWNGKRLVKLDDSTGKCVWEEKRLNTQCFGLQPRKNSTGGEITSYNECEQACCDAYKKNNNNDKKKSCEIFQEMNGRGCFTSDNKKIYCDDKIQGKYEGGRKCIPNFCDGKEDKMLAAYKIKISIVE